MLRFRSTWRAVKINYAQKQKETPPSEVGVLFRPLLLLRMMMRKGREKAI